MTTGHISAALISSVILTLLSGGAKAEVLTFDDLPNVPHQGAMQNGYGNLDWTNFYYVDGFNNDYNPSGYSVGTVSDSNVIFNGHGRSASFSSASAFTLSSLYVTAAWRDGLDVTLTGELDGHVKDSATYVVNSEEPSLIHPNFTGIDELIISASGGTHNPAYPSADNTQIAIDNISLSFYASEKGYSVGNPFLPSSQPSSAVKDFSSITVYSGVPVYFDPQSASAYSFVNTGGAKFSGFEVPFTDADGKYDVSLYDAATGKYVFYETVSAGEWVQFAGTGIDNFLVSGISGYGGAETFGLTFATDGQADFAQTAIGNVSAVPLPSAMPLMGSALLGLAAAGCFARRRPRETAPTP